MIENSIKPDEHLNRRPKSKKQHAEALFLSDDQTNGIAEIFQKGLEMHGAQRPLASW